MTMQPVERPAGTLDAQIHYAETLAKSNLLPAAYRDRPANVLLAAQLGDALGIPTIQAINSIHVIEGKPSAGADLIASIVRRSGHKLRIVETRDQDGPVVVAKLIRADDPDFEFTATWDTSKARTAGLLGKDNWKKYPGQMMRNRAVMEVCRMGASDAMYGVSYDPEELEGSPAWSSDERDWWAEAETAATLEQLKAIWAEAHRQHQLTDQLREHIQARKAVIANAVVVQAEPIHEAEVIDETTGEITTPAPQPHVKQATVRAIIRELERCGVAPGTADSYLSAFGIPRERITDLTQDEAAELLVACKALTRDDLVEMMAQAAGAER